MLPGARKCETGVAIMSDRLDQETEEQAAGAAGTAAPGSFNRRAILRGATVVVPTVLTLGSGAALAASSFSVTASNTNSPAGTSYACLDTQGQPGPRYYYDGGARVSLVDANLWFVKKSEFAMVCDPKHWDITAQVNKALENPALPKYRGNQLCADGQTYIKLASQTTCQTSGDKPFLQEVSLGNPGALMSAAAMSSVTASGKLTIAKSI